ncbi:hypothetical protein E1B28_006248 [Marasmius oreades]|uniref:Myb-like domain-containing protein n=1 Tax=Marasmius oreades TaxID=181124 RepID=A0A9P7UWC6_9AGAR|nr:uncharacterized protein E1B28_006248 [Marasmius oreades]KAG7095509.1 hypothetical protein E1B28_006248 [Marasmius oreades]
MTSRVQKGNAVFRPLAKQRSRPTPAPPSQTSVNNEYLGATSTAPSSPTAPSQPQTVVDQRQQTQAQGPLQRTNTVIPLSTPIGVPLSFSPPAAQTQAPSIVPSSSSHHPTRIQTYPRSTPVSLPSPAPPQIQSSARSWSQTQAPVSNNLVTTQVTNDNSNNNEPSSSEVHSRTTTAAEQSGEQRDASQIVIDGIDDKTTENKRTKRKRTSTATIEETEGEEDGNEMIVDGSEAAEPRTSKKKSRPKAKASSSGTKPKRTTRKSTPDPSSPTDGSSTKTSAWKRTRRSHSQTPSPFDPSTDPGAELDPTLTTMAALCEDTGRGRVSSKAVEILSNHEAWKKERKERRVRLKMMMERKKYGLAEEEEEERRAGKEKELSKVLEQADNGNLLSPAPGLNPEEPANSNGNPDDFDYSQSLQHSRFKVQVRIGPNGETIIDEESLVVDRVEGEQGEGEYEKVIESDMTKFVNSGTYGKRFRGSRWSKEETELFYDALAQYGENYELISYILPGRDRKACKNKFKAEDKRDPGRINQYLNNRIPVDIKTLARMTGKDFSGPTPQISLPPPIRSPEDTSGANAAPEPNSISLAERGRKEKQGNSSASKRSRSRTTVLEDGVEVLGDVDAYAMDD